MSVRRICEGMMSVRFGSGALRGVMCVYLCFGGDSKKRVGHLSAERRSLSVLICTALDSTVLLFCPTFTQTQCAAVAMVLL